MDKYRPAGSVFAEKILHTIYFVFRGFTTTFILMPLKMKSLGQICLGGNGIYSVNVYQKENHVIISLFLLRN